MFLCKKYTVTNFHSHKECKCKVRTWMKLVWVNRYLPHPQVKLIHILQLHPRHCLCLAAFATSMCLNKTQKESLLFLMSPMSLKALNRTVTACFVSTAWSGCTVFMSPGAAPAMATFTTWWCFGRAVILSTLTLTWRTVRGTCTVTPTTPLLLLQDWYFQDAQNVLYRLTNMMHLILRKPTCLPTSIPMMTEVGISFSTY